MNDDQNNIKKWIKSEVLIAFSVGSVIVGAINYFTSPVNSLNVQMAVVQNQIAELKSNDLVHIELEQTDIAQTQADQEAQISRLNDNTVEILTILKAQPIKGIK